MAISEVAKVFSRTEELTEEDHDPDDIYNVDYQEADET
jgi:hypothetical protein